MKFLVITILSVGGFFAVHFYTGPWGGGGSSADSGEGTAAPAAPADEAGSEATGAAAGAPDPGGDVLAPEGGESEPAPPDRLGTQLERLLAETDRAWDELEAADRNPATHNRSPVIARAYSRILRGTYNKPSLAGLQRKLVRRLTEISRHLFFTATPYYGDESGFVKMVQIDGKLDTIGRRHGLSYQFINLMRGEDPENGLYHKGDEIKIVEAKEFGGYLMHIDKNDFYMDLYIGGVFAARFPVGHGKDTRPTPAGETIVVARERYPQWTDPESGKVYQYGEDGHILGPVWLAFERRAGFNGLGIHGYTGDGRATGARASNGCIRMENEHAMMLYNVLVPCGHYESGFISRAPMNVEIVE